MGILILLTILAGPGLPGAVGPLPKGQIIEKVSCREVPNNSYALYVPTSYSPDRPAPLLLLFDPMSRAVLPMEKFKDAAETWGFILASSYDTRNYRSWDENRIGVEAMWNDVLQRYRVDSKRMYVGGLSGGARLASRVAFVTNQVAGLVACGAGFWVRERDAPSPQFDVISTVGTRDFNYMELLDLENELNRRHTSNRRLIFDGGHQWPSPTECFEVLAWLQVQAFGRGQIGEAQLNAPLQLEKRLATIQDLEKHHLVYLAVARYQQLIADLEGVTDTSSLKEKLNEILKSEDYKKYRKQEKRALQMERAQQLELINHLKQGEQKTSESPLALNVEYSWWRKQAARLHAEREDESNQPGALAAQRLISSVRANIIETTIYLLREKSFSKVLFINKVGEELSPESLDHFYNQAIAYGALANKEKALEALEQVLKLGYRQFAHMRTDEDLEPLRSEREFELLLGRYENKE